MTSYNLSISQWNNYAVKAIRLKNRDHWYPVLLETHQDPICMTDLFKRANTLTWKCVSMNIQEYAYSVNIQEYVLGSPDWEPLSSTRPQCFQIPLYGTYCFKHQRRYYKHSHCIKCVNWLLVIRGWIHSISHTTRWFLPSPMMRQTHMKPRLEKEFSTFSTPSTLFELQDPGFDNHCLLDDQRGKFKIITFSRPGTLITGRLQNPCHNGRKQSQESVQRDPKHCLFSLR